MGYVSFNDVIELNGILKEKGLNFKTVLLDRTIWKLRM